LEPTKSSRTASSEVYPITTHQESGGFGDVSNFNRAFLAAFGVSPAHTARHHAARFECCRIASVSVEAGAGGMLCR
jgi:AraC-like DNA-binding protein